MNDDIDDLDDDNTDDSDSDSADSISIDAESMKEIEGLTDLAVALHDRTMACKVDFHNFHNHRKTDHKHRQQSADLFGASVDRIKEGKTLLNTKHPQYKAVTRVMGEAKRYWHSITQPFIENSTRLIKPDLADEFAVRMDAYGIELEEKKAALQAVHDELIDDARNKLGVLFSASDFPMSIADSFGFEYSLRKYVLMDEHLDVFSPALRSREKDKLVALYAQGVIKGQEDSRKQLLKMVEKIFNTLDGTETGKPKRFNESLIENPRKLIREFRVKSIGIDPEMEGIVAKMEEALDGVSCEALRKDGTLRGDVANRVNAIQSLLEDSMVDRPKRVMKIKKKGIDTDA